jgi:hypothetical protein
MFVTKAAFAGVGAGLRIALLASANRMKFAALE